MVVCSSFFWSDLQINFCAPLSLSLHHRLPPMLLLIVIMTTFVFYYFCCICSSSSSLFCGINGRLPTSLFIVIGHRSSIAPGAPLRFSKNFKRHGAQSWLKMKRMNRKEHKRKAQGKFTHYFNRHVKTSFKIQTDDILHFSNSENKGRRHSFNCSPSRSSKRVSYAAARVWCCSSEPTVYVIIIE